MQPPFPEPPIPLAGPGHATFRSLLRTCGLLKRTMDGYFARHNISGSQWGVLMTLHRAWREEHATGLLMSDLSDRLLIRPPSVTGVIDRLERLKLVERHASPTDLRAKEVRLTAQGRKLLEDGMRSHAAQVQSILAALPEKDQQQLSHLLEKLCGHLEALAEETEAAPTFPAPSKGTLR